MNPKQTLQEIFKAGLQAVMPDEAVHRLVHLDGSRLHVGERAFDLTRFGRIHVIGAGKGAAPMAQALEEILGERIDGGDVIVKYGHTRSLKRIRLHEASHPVPDEAGLAATETLLAKIGECREDDLILAVFAGGASALTAAPIPPVTLAEKQETTRQLLACGADIKEINTLRKHLSQIKGGRLAARIEPATLVCLIVSDVVGNDLSAIGSGPAAPDPSSYADCLEIVARYHLADRLPASVMDVLREGLAGERPETPKEGKVFERVHNLIIADNAGALQAAASRAGELGYASLILTSSMEGEAREVAKLLAAIARESSTMARPIKPPACLLAGGETTVTIQGEGKGGRNQELALALAIALDGEEKIHALCAGTDGTDGPTDAAGACVSGDTVQRAASMGCNAREHLANNDAYPFFSTTGDLLITGPTLTNVMDLTIILLED